MKLIKPLILLAFLPTAQADHYFVGGRYSLQGPSAVSNVRDETSLVLNPAGLGQIKSEKISSGASNIRYQYSQDDQSYSNLNFIANFVGLTTKLSNYQLGFALSSWQEFNQIFINESKKKDTDSQVDSSYTKTERQHSI